MRLNRFLPRKRNLVLQRRNQTQSQIISQYQQEGVVCIRNVINKDLIKKLKLGVEKNVASPHPQFSEFLKGRTNQESEKGGFFFNDYCNWQRIQEFKDVLVESILPQLARDLMQSNTVTFYHEHVLVKEPHCLRATPWHHDQPYYPVDGHQNVSFWIPLDPITSNRNGVYYIPGSHKNGVYYIPGSHKWNKWFRPTKFASLEGYHLSEQEMNETDWNQKKYIDLNQNEIEEEIKDGILKSVTWDMVPGDVVAFNFLTLHGGPGNVTSDPRRVVAFRFTGDDGTITTKRPWKAVSPPVFGGLKHGQKLNESETFPDLTNLTKKAFNLPSRFEPAT